MDELVEIDRKEIWLAQPADIQPRRFVGRAQELQMCRIAWGLSADGAELLASSLSPLAFRLEGPPGLGKNEIVYEIASRLEMPLYIMQGHEEFTPEDLSLLLTPDPNAEYGGPIPLTLRASALATALYTGGLFFFDEINRVPERALSPLASVLDGRQSLYSAMTGITIAPRDKEARRTFRFCCALNPSLSNDGLVLPEYIKQRTLPVIEVARPPFDDIRRIIEETLDVSPSLLSEFDEWYSHHEHEEISVRQLIALMNYAVKYQEQVGRPEGGVLRKIAHLVIGRRA